jgi:hypothetical protein
VDWIILDAVTVAAHLPADLAAAYTTWLAANPDKSGRLGEIVANTLAEVRDNIRSNPANTLDADATKIPQSCVRHAENIIFFQLAMEMGLDIDTEGNQSMTRADIFLRQISFKRFTTSGGEAAASPSPSYAVPDRPASPALPLLLVLALLLVSPAHAGWVANPRRASVDTEIQVTLAPRAYTNTTITLFGHLQGIDNRLDLILPTLSGAYLERNTWDGGTNNLNRTTAWQSLGLGDPAHIGWGVFMSATNGCAYGGLFIPPWGEAPPATGIGNVGSESLRFRGRKYNGLSYGVDVFVGNYPEDPQGEWNLILSNTWNRKRGIVLTSALLDLIAGPGLGVTTNWQGIPQLAATNLSSGAGSNDFAALGSYTYTGGEVEVTFDLDPLYSALDLQISGQYTPTNTTGVKPVFGVKINGVPSPYYVDMKYDTYGDVHPNSAHQFAASYPYTTNFFALFYTAARNQNTEYTRGMTAARWTFINSARGIHMDGRGHASYSTDFGGDYTFDAYGSLRTNNYTTGNVITQMTFFCVNVTNGEYLVASSSNATIRLWGIK